MAEKGVISERISLKAVAVSGSCKIKKICTVRGETFLLTTTSVQMLSIHSPVMPRPVVASLAVGLTVQGSLQKSLGNK